jgi:hypothetical protein
MRPAILTGLAALALAAGGTGALAQTDSVFRNQETAPGKPLRIGVYANVEKDCKIGPPLEVKVLTPPKNGSLAVRNVKIKTDRIKNCPGLEVPVQAVLYQSNASYKGPDEVVYEVKQPDGKIRSHTVRITVTDKPAAPAGGAAKKDDAVDL